jgi:coenzyme PQQ precursor peptide PqqA
LTDGTGAAYVEPVSNITEEHVMAWKSPKVAEVALGGEINSYVCAKLK